MPKIPDPADVRNLSPEPVLFRSFRYRPHYSQALWVRNSSPRLSMIAAIGAS